MTDAAEIVELRKRQRQLAPTGPTETIRIRLGLTMLEFSDALGLSAGTYAEQVRKNLVTKTVALAAEALMRRQAASDAVFLVRVVKGGRR